MASTTAAQQNVSGIPDIKVSARQLFGIDTDMEVPAFSSATEHVPPRHCEQCGALIRYTSRSGPAGYARKRFCGNPCAARARGGSTVPIAQRLAHQAAIAQWRARADHAWMDAAACAALPPEQREWFYHGDSQSRLARDHRDRLALAVCRGCPVLRTCRRYALMTEETYGVWGGMTQDQRRERLARARHTGGAPAATH